MGDELRTDLGPVVIEPDTGRRAALNAAAEIAADYPHLTAAELAAHPKARADLHQLLTVLGLDRKGKP